MGQAQLGTKLRHSRSLQQGPSAYPCSYLTGLREGGFQAGGSPPPIPSFHPSLAMCLANQPSFFFPWQMSH